MTTDTPHPDPHPLEPPARRGSRAGVVSVQAPAGRSLPGIGDAAYLDDGVGGALVGESVVVVDAVGPGSHDAVERALRSAVARVGA